tara:strand:- start:1241 stop:1675 length:435 start_codon:yes stop_codon:yes gene_type:complete
MNEPLLTRVLNQLYAYSNVFLSVRNDRTLPIPGFSTIEQDIYGRNIPTIIINLSLIPNDENVLAHILSHEWGHHVSKHLSVENMPPKQHISYITDHQQKENEADLYAAKFITHYKYNKASIIDFFRQHPMDITNRINILTNVKI